MADTDERERRSRAEQRARQAFDFVSRGRDKFWYTVEAILVVVLAGLVFLQAPRLYEQFFHNPPVSGMDKDDVALQLGETYDIKYGTLTVSNLRRNGTEVCVDLIADLRDGRSTYLHDFTLYLPSGAGFRWNPDFDQELLTKTVDDGVPAERCWETHASEQGKYWVQFPNLSNKSDYVDVFWGGEL